MLFTHLWNCHGNLNEIIEGFFSLISAILYQKVMSYDCINFKCIIIPLSCHIMLKAHVNP